ncbi:MAG: hypothetical protein CMP48_19670 [Rickettsiales bacterium]|nr:hypothetical protein [Rickettsiales bacterium]
MGLNYKLVWCVVLVICSFAVSASSFDSLRMEKQGDQFFIIHKVEQGETLYSLARRYGCELPAIKSANNLPDNNIDLGQELRIPTNGSLADKTAITTSEVSEEVTSTLHTVEPKQTLYAISKLYGVDVDQIKEWNGLTSNELSVGQVLTIVPSATTDPYEKPISSSDKGKEKIKEKDKKPKKNEVKEPEIPEGFNIYYVQTGDLLETIAAKYKVRPDSLVIWNKLPNTYLTIGQKLLIKGTPDKEEMNRRKNVENLGYGTRRKVTDGGGFTKMIEEGTARKIEDVVDTKKYLALHRTLPIGSMIEVRNLMNNQKIFVKVVGKLPETGLNKNVLVRLSPICFERLGVIDPMTRVEVSYFID